MDDTNIPVPSDIKIQIETLDNAFKDSFEKITRRILILETIILKRFGSKAIINGEKVVQLLDKNMMRLRSSAGSSSRSRSRSPLQPARKRKRANKNCNASREDHSDLIIIKEEGRSDSENTNVRSFAATEEQDVSIKNIVGGDELRQPFTLHTDEDSTDSNTEVIFRDKAVVVTRSGRRSKPTVKVSMLEAVKIKKENSEWAANESQSLDSSLSHICDQCGKAMKSAGNLRTHRLRLHFQKWKFFCEYCHQAFPTQFKRDYHAKIHTENRPHTCEVEDCEAAFKFRTQLVVHYRVHQAVRKFSCNVCGRTYKHKSGLNLHMLMHKQMKLYGCPKCCKKFYTRTHVKRHLRQFHRCDYEDMDITKDVVQEEPRPPKKPKVVKPRRPVTERIVCDQCGTSVLKNNFKHHLGTHELLYSCDQCGKGFATEFGVRSHVEHTHDLDKPFLCNFPDCESRFNSVSNLKTHQVSHTEERRFHCEPCNRSYKHKGGLKVHINACHSKDKQFPCIICPVDETKPKVFDTRTHLKRHMIKVHKIDNDQADSITKVEKKPKGQPPRLACEFCIKTYKNKHDLRLHENAAHTHETQFPCHLCNKTFYRKNHKKRHLVKVHNVLEGTENPEQPKHEEEEEDEDEDEFIPVEVLEVEEIPSSSEYPVYQTVQLNSETVVHIVTEYEEEEIVTS